MIGTPNRGSPFMDWCAVSQLSCLSDSRILKLSLDQANIGVGSSSLAKAKAAAKAAAKSRLPPYSLKSPLLARPHEMADKLQEDMQNQADRNSSIFGIPSLFGSSITNYLLGLLDSPAYGNLTTHYLNEHFNPLTPDDPSVKYMSTAGRINKLSVLHPLWFPKLILDAAAERGYAEEEGKSGKDYEGNDGLVSVSSAKWGEWLGVVDNCHHWDLRGEGGLLPQGGTFENKPEGRPDPSVPGGWDWNAVARAAEGEGAAAGIAKIENLRKTADAVSNTIKELGGKSTQVVKSSLSKTLPDTPANWDMAQVGQVVDWVADLLPGSSQAASEKTVGSRQLADAAKEKAREEKREEDRRDWASTRDGADKIRERLASAEFHQGPASMRQTQSYGPRERSMQEKKKNQRFDLGSFYGGLMVKLSEEGL
jgi:triacylglycerol lipase